MPQTQSANTERRQERINKGLEGLKFVKEWTVLMTTLATGGVAAIGFLKDFIPTVFWAELTSSIVTGIALISLLISFYMAMGVLFALPSILDQLPPKNNEDIWMMSGYGGQGTPLYDLVTWHFWATMVSLAAFFTLVFVLVLAKVITSHPSLPH